MLHALVQALARRVFLALAALAVIPLSQAHAGANVGATAQLCWSATDTTQKDLATPGASNNLYVVVRRGGALQFKGAELDLTWTPAGDPDAGCFAHIGSVFKTSSGTTCTYLNRGSAVPVTVNDDPGHYHVAWANTSSLTSCTAGAVIQMQFEFDGCADARGCFTLNSLTLLDASSLQDKAIVSGPFASVLNGACVGGGAPPVVDPIADQNVVVGSRLTVDPHAVDPDGDPFTWSGRNLPPGAAVDAATGTLSWMPDSTQVGTYTGVTLTATDTHGLSGSASFAITATAGYVNHPPVLSPAGPFTIVETSTLSFFLAATDPDGDRLTFDLTPLPTGATFANAQLSWTPAIGQAGAYLLHATVTDPFGASDTEDIQITVTPLQGASFRASLTWSTSGVVSNLAAPGASAGLYIRLVGAASYKGAEADLVWTPIDPGCFELNAYQFRTGTTCTWMNRGSAVPIVTADEPGHLHVAWANTLTNSACADGGNIIDLQISFAGCDTAQGCFTLRSLSVLDGNNQLSYPVLADPVATVLGGSAACNGTNVAPVVQPIADQIASAGQQLVVTPSGSDPNGDVITWSGSQLPAGATVDDASGTLRWTPDAAQVGSYPGVTLTATDPAGLSGAASFAITVVAGNHPPVLAPAGPFSVQETSSLTFVLSATDADGDSLTFELTPLPDGATFAGAQFAWTPAVGQAGNYVLHATVRDPFGGTDTETISIAVSYLPGGTDSLRASLTWATSGVVTDLATPGETDDLYIRVTGATSFKGAEIDLTWTPYDTGCFELASTIYRTSTSCTWMNRGTALPIVTTDEPGHYHVAWANSLVNTMCAGGGNIIDLMFDFTGCTLPRGCFTLHSLTVLDGNNQLATPVLSDPVATVLGGSPSCGAVNSPPVVLPIPDQQVVAGHLLLVTASGSDPDGDPLTWSGANLPPNAAVDQATGVLSWTPTSAQVGTYANVTLEARDPLFASGSAAFAITVAGNQPPTVDPIATVIVLTGEPVSVTPVAHDPEGDALTWGMTDNPPGATLDPLTGVFSWTGSAQPDSFMSVVLTAYDTAGGHGSATFAIIVLPDLPPVVTPIPAQQLPPGTALSLQAAGYDPEGQPLTWWMTGNPSDATLDPATGAFFWPGSAVEDTFPAVTIGARDPGGHDGSTTFGITVIAGRVYYLDSASPCSVCDGLSWAGAVKTFDAALPLLRRGTGDTLRVAEGQYVAASVPNVVAGAKVYGGYPHGGGPRDLPRRRTLVRPAGPYGSAFVLAEAGSVIDGVVVTGSSYATLVSLAADRDTLRSVVFANTRTVGVPLLVYGTHALVDRCIFTNCVSSGLGSIETGAASAATIRDCTLYGDSSRVATGTAGIYALGRVTVINTVLWRLGPAQLPAIYALGDSADVRYCDVQGGYPGTGNLAVDPAFCNPNAKVFTLQSASPLIGAGENGTTIGAIDIVGCAGAAAVAGAEGDTPERSGLVTKTPLLASQGAEVAFTLADAAEVALEVFTVRGTRVATLAHGPMEAGRYNFAWARRGDDGRRVPAGVYVVRFRADSLSETRRICVVE